MKCEFPGCDRPSVDFHDIDDEDGVNCCQPHIDMGLDEVLEDNLNGPFHTWLRTRPTPFPA